ncbi:MAG TPA: LysR substrate-binding domain-containing protein [Acidimicrobiales bacterium]|jgi:DNA-binding transcriptional LysR family regulator|nr:LysR substrate-binding domain-containing protein [Acidimicrobiales bacterium]
MSIRFSLRQLEYFLAAARHESMSEAADALDVSQSTVSVAVAALERELGVQLFHRRPAKGLVLTPAGRRLRAEARRVLAEAETLAERASLEGGELAGVLAVACFAPLAPFVLPRLIAAFAEASPRVTVRFEEGSLLSVQQAVLDGEAELAITYDHELGPQLEARTLLANRPMHVVTARDHRLSGRPAVRLEELRGEPLAVVDVAPSHQLLQALLARAGLAGQVRYRTTTYELACALAGRGLACALLGFGAVGAVSCEGLPLSSATLEAPGPHFSVVAASATGARLTRRAEAFLECAHATLVHEIGSATR